MKLNSSPRLTLIATASLATVSALFSASAQAESATLVRLVHRLDNYVADFRKEVTIHFIHTSAYRHLVADANSMIREVAHIDDLVHDGYRALPHIEQDLEDLDKLAHHVHDLFDDVDAGRYGHTHGDTDHVHDLIRAINSTIHSMQDVVEDLMHHRDDDDYHHHDDDDHYRGDRSYREYREYDTIPRAGRMGDVHRH